MQYNYLFIFEDYDTLIVNRELTVDDLKSVQIIDLNTFTEYINGEWQPIQQENK